MIFVVLLVCVVSFVVGVGVGALLEFVEHKDRYRDALDALEQMARR